MEYVAFIPIKIYICNDTDKYNHVYQIETCSYLSRGFSIFSSMLSFLNIYLEIVAIKKRRFKTKVFFSVFQRTIVNIWELSKYHHVSYN